MNRFVSIYQLTFIIVMIMNFNNQVFSQEVLVEVSGATSSAALDGGWQSFATEPAINKSLFSISVKLDSGVDEMSAARDIYIDLYSTALTDASTLCRPAFSGLLATSDIVQIQNISEQIVEFNFSTLTPLAPNSMYYFEVKDDVPSDGTQRIYLNIDPDNNGGANGGAPGGSASAGASGACGTLEHIVKTIDNYEINVNVNGLAGTNSVSFSNATDTLNVMADGNYTISTLNDLSAFEVVITDQPQMPTQFCDFTNANSGNLDGSNVQINVECVAVAYNVGVDVNGLAFENSLQVLNDGVELIEVNANGVTLFSIPQLDQETYNISVITQPTSPNQTCTVVDGQGTINAEETILTINCITIPYSIGVNVSGLSNGNSLSLLNNSVDLLQVNANGLTFFNNQQLDETDYNAIIVTQPTNPNQVCAVENGQGTIAGQNIILNVECLSFYTIGVDVSGLNINNSLSFLNNGTDLLQVNSNGLTLFNNKLLDQIGYDVSLNTQPSDPDQFCTLTNSTGTVLSANAVVTVECVNLYNVGVNVSGLAKNNSVNFVNEGIDLLQADSNGITFFTTQLTNSTFYNITVAQQPTMPNQECLISSGSGFISGADSIINVECVTTQYDVGVNVSGLAADNSVALVNNLSDLITVNANETIFFNFSQADATQYDITVITQPTEPNQLCEVINGNAFVNGTDAIVSVICSNIQYSLGVNVAGLAKNNTIQLINNGTNFLNVDTNGLTQFSQQIPDFSSYDVTLLNQPTSPNQTCSFGTGSTGIINGNNTELSLNCITNSYFISGSVSGLLENNSFSVSNIDQTQIISENGAFVLDAPLLDEQKYNVIIKQQPDDPIQPCNVINPSGVVTGTDVVNIELICEIGLDFLFLNGFEELPDTR
ncbi:MAG: hypothetical protein AB8B80_15795 [Marinicellaceae bacterium]